MRYTEQLEKELEKNEEKLLKLECNLVFRAVETFEWNRLVNITKGEINALKWALNKK